MVSELLAAPSKLPWDGFPMAFSSRTTAACCNVRPLFSPPPIEVVSRSSVIASMTFKPDDAGLCAHFRQSLLGTFQISTVSSRCDLTSTVRQLAVSAKLRPKGGPVHSGCRLGHNPKSLYNCETAVIFLLHEAAVFVLREALGKPD